MTDRERTIKDFEYLVRKADGEGWDFVDVTTEQGYKILALLKEQKAVKSKIDAFGHPYCPKCKILVYQTWNFCPHCGQAVKRNG